MDDSRARTKETKSNIGSTNASAKMCAHNAYASINKPKRDTVDPNLHNWGYKASCLKLNWESDNRMARAESAGGGGAAKQRAPDVMVTKIILVGLLCFLELEWLMQFVFFSFESYLQTTADALYHA